MDNSFEEYVERYCKTYGLTPEEAKEHKLVQEVESYYEENKKEVIYETSDYISNP